MYEKYPGITPPPLDAVLWRYMPYCRFASLLENSALWFTRADKFDDEHEGSITQTSWATHKYRLVDAAAEKRLANNLKHARSFTLANCWHWNDRENVSMWDRYCKGDGIAIKTTFQRLVTSLICHEPIYVGLVNYIDYNADDFSTDSTFYALLHKRMEFGDEREIRALSYLLADGPLRWIKITPDLTPRCETGEYRSVNVHELIQEIVVSPNATRDQLKCVQEKCRGTGLQIPVRDSSIGEPPLWARFGA